MQRDLIVICRLVLAADVLEQLDVGGLGAAGIERREAWISIRSCSGRTLSVNGGNVAIGVAHEGGERRKGRGLGASFAGRAGNPGLHSVAV